MGAVEDDEEMLQDGGVQVRDLLSQPELTETLRLVAGAAGANRRISHPRVQKSGLVLVEHSQGIVPSRVQVLGETEITYLEKQDAETRRSRVRFLFGLNLSLVVLTRGVEPLPELVEQAEATGTALVVSSPRSSTTINAIHAVLDRVLAPSATLHGVFVEVHGIGTLLTGPSGIGKSECALFLVERGHRLVADDVVHVTRMATRYLVGTPAPLLRHHLEIRGLGILNIRDLFGATAVREEARIGLVVELCPWKAEETYERLGLEDTTREMLGVDLPHLRVPVRPGRAMGLMVEIAARNQLLKLEGLHGAQAFTERLERSLGVG